MCGGEKAPEQRQPGNDKGEVSPIDTQEWIGIFVSSVRLNRLQGSQHLPLHGGYIRSIGHNAIAFDVGTTGLASRKGGS
jgi:hypothetical protein